MLNRRPWGFSTIVTLVLVSTLFIVLQPYPIPAYSAAGLTISQTASPKITSTWPAAHTGTSAPLALPQAKADGTDYLLWLALPSEPTLRADSAAQSTLLPAYYRTLARANIARVALRLQLWKELGLILDFEPLPTANAVRVRVRQVGDAPRFTDLPEVVQVTEANSAQISAAEAALKGVWRLLRCHPFCKGGYDPVE